MSLIISTKNISIRSKNYALLLIPSTDATALTQPPFSPTDISGIKAWWDADSILGLADGATLSTWRDKSGNGFDLSVGTGTTTIRRNILNGKSIVRFTGSQRLTCANVLASKSSISIFLVIIPKATSYGILFEQGVSDLSYENGGSLDGRFYIGNSGGATGPTVGVQNISQYTSLLANGYQLTQYKNGIAGLSTSFSGNTSASTFNLGARSNNTSFTTTDVAELIIYDRCVTTEERKQIESYLASKYGF